MKKLEFMAFWAINDEINVDRACAQLDEMKRLGLTGVIFHPRNYPGKPEYLGNEYLKRLSDIIIYAKKIGMDFWLYDENGYPSGTASGKVLEENPTAKCMWLEYHNGEIIYQEKNAVSTLDKKVCGDFIRITFDGYKQGLSKEAFDYVTGFFSDEVGFLDGHSVSLEHGGVPWCENMEERYRSQYGESLKEKLPLLFENRKGYELVRERFWELVTGILQENFYRPIQQWCTQNHKRYTAHLKGEENIFFNISYNGSPYEVLKEVSVPAVDALERYPGNHYYPHIASSIARQFYDGKCLCEAMGGSGWGVSPDDFVTYMKWLVECGINMFTFHLAQYTLKAQAIRDWPPSTPFHLSWKEAFPEALRRIQEYKECIDSQESEKSRTLIITPTRGCMREFVPAETNVINEHNGAGVPDTSAGKISNDYEQLIEACYQSGMLYDVTEEKIVEDYAVIREEGVRMGNMLYHQVLIGQGCSFHDTELEKKLRLFVSQSHQNTNSREMVAEPFYKLLEEDATEWNVLMDGENQILLELMREDSLVKHCCVPFRNMEEIQDIRLVVSDPVEQIKINGCSATNVESNEQGTMYNIEAKHFCGGQNKEGQLKIEVTMLEDGEKEPFLFLQGKFLVRSQSGYEEKKQKQLYTDGDFFLTCDGASPHAEELISYGYPFRVQPVFMEKMVAIPKEAVYMQLSGYDGAAVKIRIGDGNPVWVFHADEFVKLPMDREDKEYLIHMELYPSTYNMYGPHHHMDGDRHLVSPNQYIGKKNFADDKDSPENTSVSGFHFVKLGIEKKIIFYGR